MFPTLDPLLHSELRLAVMSLLVRYAPPFQVYDGWQWSLYISFDDKSSVSSSGHMESPRGDGLKRLEEYLKDVWAKVDESQAEIVDIW